MVNSLENIDKSKVYVDRIEGLDEVVEDVIGDTLIGAVSTITTSDLNANKVLVSDANGKVSASSIAVSDIPNDSNLVHKSGDETIGGTKTFTSEINGYLKSYTATNNDSAASPYKKIGECVISGRYKSVVVPFLYSKTATAVDDSLYTGKIMLRVDDIAGTFANANSGFILNVFPDIVKNDEIIFYLCYKNNYPTSNDVTCQFWIYVKHTYNGIHILPLRQGLGSSSSSTSQITWGSNLVEAASLPSGYTSIKHIFTKGNIETPTISDDSTHIATTAYVKAQGYAVDSGVVHTSGNETIAGTKTFSSTISGNIDGNANTVTNGVYTTGNQTIAGNKTFSGTTAITGQLQSKRNNNDARILSYYANYTKGTAPTATQYSGIKIVDDAGTEIGDFYGRISTGNTNSAFMTVKDPGTGTTTKQIAIHYPADGTAYTEAPTPTTSDNSTKIATTAYVKAQGYATDSGVVHLTGEETIDGLKHFKSGFSVNNNGVKGTAPVSVLTRQMQFADKNNTLLGTVYNTYATNKDVTVGLSARKANAASDDGVIYLSLNYNANGDKYATAPASDVNGSILTTVNKTKSNNGYFKLGNGMLVQWGVSDSTSQTSERTVTLPTAFAANNYTVALTVYNSDAGIHRIMHYTAKTTTTFKFYVDAATSTMITWIAIGY